MIVLYILAIFGLAFFIKEADGPWGLMAGLRNKLMNNKYVGVFFFKLFECYFCVGCHAGWIVYLLIEPMVFWSPFLFICWMLAGGVISLILDGLLVKLHNEK